jgi:hypothetical protein
MIALYLALLLPTGELPPAIRPLPPAKSDAAEWRETLALLISRVKALEATVSELKRHNDYLAGKHNELLRWVLATETQRAHSLRTQSRPVRLRQVQATGITDADSCTGGT